MLPQQPSDAPATPASPTAIRRRRKWEWLIFAGMVLIVSLFVIVEAWHLSGLRRHHDAPRIEAIYNLRSIGLALFEFEVEYGMFPDVNTAKAVRSSSGTDLDMEGNSSNALFRQLLGSGIEATETIFHAGVKGARKPDNNITKGEALKKGECGYTYFPGGRPADGSNRPLAATPMIPGTDRFEKTRGFAGKAVILRMDNSVISLPIDKNGHVMIDGRNMMDPHHPIWHGRAPTIAWPEL